MLEKTVTSYAGTLGSDLILMDSQSVFYQILKNLMG